MPSHVLKSLSVSASRATVHVRDYFRNLARRMSGARADEMPGSRTWDVPDWARVVGCSRMQGRLVSGGAFGDRAAGEGDCTEC